MRTGIVAASLALTASLAFATAAAGDPQALAAEPGPATASAVTAAPARPSALPFVEDDYDRALREARASKRPLFVEAWAPW